MPDGSINPDTLKLLGDRADKFNHYKSVPYKLEVPKQATKILENIYYVEDEDLLYKLSKSAEPASDGDPPSGTYNNNSNKIQLHYSNFLPLMFLQSQVLPKSKEHSCENLPKKMKNLTPKNQ